MARVVQVFVTTPAKIDEDRIRGAGGELHRIPCGNREDELIAAGYDADVMIIASAQPFTRRVIERLDKCKLLATIGVGYNGVDLEAATDFGVCVCNNPYYGLDEVSDHAMTLILSCGRKIVRLDRAVRAGAWRSLTGDIHREILPPIARLRGQTLGIIGLGNIARALVPKARGFGMRVIAYSRHVNEALARIDGVQIVDLDTLLRESDYISLHSALSPQTRHLIGGEQFRKMKPTAYLINTARGAIVDEEALVVALQSGYIAGAGLDVTTREPLEADHPLSKMDNVILTGHTAYFSDQAVHDQGLWTQEEVVRMLRGQRPIALVNPRVVDKFIAKWGAFLPAAS